MAKRKTKKTSRNAWVEPSALDRLRTIGAWFGGIFLTILGIWGSAHVREQVTTDPRYSLESWQLDLVELPRWVTPQIRAELESLVDFAPEAGAPEAGAPEVPTLFDRGVLRRVQEQLESSPWVERLVDVRLTYPGTSRPGAVHVELGLRRPVALVESGRLYYLTDRDRCRMGAPYDYAPTEWFGIPRISGGEGNIVNVPRPGERWDSVHVANGIWVANFLHDQQVIEEFPDRPIEVIDVSNIGGRDRRTESEIVLIWEGRRLTWGQAPLSAGPRTVSLESIVQNLRQVLREPRVYGGYAEINIHRARMTAIPAPAG